MLDDMSERAANDIREKVGIDVRGFKTTIEPRIVEHIIRDHGENGLADHSMADTNDIARIQYVLNNYDTVVDGGTSSAYTEPKPNYPGKNRKAKTVVFEKKIDGSYYVVEAVPVTKAKTAYVTSAYINTNKKGNQPTLNAPDGTPGFTSENVSLSSLAGDVTQVPNAAAATPSGTPETSLASPSPLNTSIQQNAENSNGLGTKTVNTMQDAMQYGKTPEQAVMEARAKAEGERVRQAREEQAAAEQQERLDRITNGKNRDIMQRVYEAQERAERVASRHALERATTRATASDADSYIDHTQEDIVCRSSPSSRTLTTS